MYKQGMLISWYGVTRDWFLAGAIISFRDLGCRKLAGQSPNLSNVLLHSYHPFATSCLFQHHKYPPRAPAPALKHVENQTTTRHISAHQGLQVEQGSRETRRTRWMASREASGRGLSQSVLFHTPVLGKKGARRNPKHRWCVVSTERGPRSISARRIRNLQAFQLGGVLKNANASTLQISCSVRHRTTCVPVTHDGGRPCAPFYPRTLFSTISS